MIELDLRDLIIITPIRFVTFLARYHKEGGIMLAIYRPWQRVSIVSIESRRNAGFWIETTECSENNENTYIGPSSCANIAVV